MHRRLFLASASAGAAAITLSSFGATAAQAVTAPKLPYEVSRIANVTTASGGRKLYDNIEVDIGGDRARIFLPQAIKRGQTTTVGAVWFQHGGGGNHNALNSGFKYPGELVVDSGAIAICLNSGGSQYTNDFAKSTQINGWKYLSSLFPVRMNFLRATSAGGALAAWTYSKKLIPYIRGLYMVNGLYDLERLLVQDADNRSNLRTAFNNDEALIRANNPARVAASSWTGTNVKVLVSDAAHPDTTLPPTQHGLALIDKITPVAKEATVGYHTLGHNTPSSSHRDMMLTFSRWSGR